MCKSTDVRFLQTETALRAELEAISLWDRLYLESRGKNELTRTAYILRQGRREEILQQFRAENGVGKPSEDGPDDLDDASN